MIPNGPQSGPSIRTLSSRPITPRQRGAWVRGSATREDRQAGREGASCTPGTSPLRVHANRDLPRKLLSPCAAPRVQDSCQEPANRDLSRKVIVTSRARPKGGHQDSPGESAREHRDLVRGLPANLHIGTECCRVRGWLRRGYGEYRPPAQGIVTLPARNGDLSRKGMVTSRARNSDLPRKRIVTPRAGNSDLSRKVIAGTSCKTSYFLGSDPVSLLCVCMFDVSVVNRERGRSWG